MEEKYLGEIPFGYINEEFMEDETVVDVSDVEEGIHLDLNEGQPDIEKLVKEAVSTEIRNRLVSANTPKAIVPVEEKPTLSQMMRQANESPAQERRVLRWFEGL